MDDELIRMRKEWFAPFRRFEQGIDVDNFKHGRFQSAGFRFGHTESLKFWDSLASYLRGQILKYAARIEGLVQGRRQNQRRELEWLSVRLEGFLNQMMAEARDTHAIAIGLKRERNDAANLPREAQALLDEIKRQLRYQINGVERRQLAPWSKVRAFFNLEYARQLTLAVISAAFGFVGGWLLKP